MSAPPVLITPVIDECVPYEAAGIFRRLNRNFLFFCRVDSKVEPSNEFIFRHLGSYCKMYMYIMPYINMYQKIAWRRFHLTPEEVGFPAPEYIITS